MTESPLAAHELTPLLDRASGAVAARLRGKGLPAFGHAAEPAQPFVAALVARAMGKRAGNLWLVCRTPRDQERFHAELANWLPEALIFPDLEIAAGEGALPDPEVSAERLDVLQKLRDATQPCVVLINEKAAGQAVPSPGALKKLETRATRGERLDREALIAQLVAAGYEPVPQVTDRGQFAVRGGIMDLYSWQQPLPVRLEWFDDEVESIREFDLDKQTSVQSLAECAILLGTPAKADSRLRNYIQKGDVVITIEAAEWDGPHGQISAGAVGEGEDDDLALYESALETGRQDFGSPALREAAQDRVRSQITEWIGAGYHLAFLYRKEAELAGLQRVVDAFTGRKDRVALLRSEAASGFVFPAAKLAIITIGALLGYPQLATERSRRRGGGALSRNRSQIDFTELTDGELVVHLEHGLARFRGLQSRRVGDVTEETLVLEFADSAKLYVPLEQAFFVSRYVGMGKRGVTLSRLGDGKWASTKKAAEKSIYDYASKLLKTQATRETHGGRSFSPDGAWQKEFEDAFPYKETPDQVRAIAETKTDMESNHSMDRLICGDVGFGKTEVAIRAAFKAVVDGRQVAMMAPTTVLAQQHFDNFRTRMAKFPVVVEMLSRYRTAAEQTRVAKGLRDGSVDLVIGTHRLISKDIEFKDLGLLVVDEEQRFGVRHKERIKERFPTVDVLTLSATPIPRTLYLALTGARELSTLETAPPSRYPIETTICAFDERIIRAAIDRELDRQGQIYFLHNRVESIARVAKRLKELCPRARVDLGHGQMEEHELEGVMQRFVAGETDVLVATTIIESGLDIPNANTIIIDRADRFGLADLYQLRGRVGRGQHKAYAYLMLPRELIAVGEARKRINAIKQYSSLGAGFKIALRDLEIRGAGNILGVAQSGHLTAVGFDLYCQLLKQAVSRLKGEQVRERLEVTLHLDFAVSSEVEYAHGESGAWPAFIPSRYIEEPRLRIQAYRQLSGVSRREEVEALAVGWRDRFGPLPETVENLLALSRLKLAAAERRIAQIETRGDKLMLTRRGEPIHVAGKFPRLTSTDAASKMREIAALTQTL